MPRTGHVIISGVKLYVIALLKGDYVAAFFANIPRFLNVVLQRRNAEFAVRDINSLGPPRHPHRQLPITESRIIWRRLFQFSDKHN